MYLDLSESEYKVTAGGITVELLPKEFALLEFLYRNRGRTFSREQLLDQVWPMEYPVERTVDDHIYRLRKKLRGFNGLDIKTVRGFGYSFSVPGSGSLSAVHPTTKDPELHRAMREVFAKYQLYGQGKSMLTLARQQDILGYEMDLFYSSYIHFVQGDLEWLIYTDEVPLKERVYSLLLFYCFSGDPGERLAYCEQLLARNILHSYQQLEMEILNILDLFALAGEPDRAIERLKQTYKVIAEPGYESFALYTAISEMFVHLIAGTGDEELERMDEAVERMLQDMPFLREIGGYKVVKGLWCLRRERWREAEQWFDEGLQVLEMSGFVPMHLYSLYKINYYCLRFPPKEALFRKYSALFAKEIEVLGLKRLEQPLRAVLDQAIDTC